MKRGQLIIIIFQKDASKELILIFGYLWLLKLATNFIERIDPWCEFSLESKDLKNAVRIIKIQ